jgi:hypothetical protein
MSATFEFWTSQISSGAVMRLFKDERPLPRFYGVKRSRSSFQILGIFGIVAAISLHMVLAKHLGLPPSLPAAVSTVTFATFLLTAWLSRIVMAKERLVYYRQTIAICISNALLLKLVGLEILPCFDVFAICFGLFLAIGRLGCLSVGCCHGRPWRWGVRYGAKQVRTGFPDWLEGVRLFPVQALESFWVFCLVVTGTVWIWRGSVPGAVFGFYIVAYAFGRFFFEFLRGDEGRPYILGFSEAQWTSIILMTGVVLAQRWHLLPWQFFALPALVFLLSIALTIALFQSLRKSSAHRLFSAKHINEIARTVLQLSDSPFCCAEIADPLNAWPIRIAQTSEGLQISLGRIQRFHHSLIHFSVSRRNPPLSSRDARFLAALMAHCRSSANPFRIVSTSRGVYHFLVAEEPLPLVRA